jgi:polyferredoxin
MYEVLFPKSTCYGKNMKKSIHSKKIGLLPYLYIFTLLFFLLPFIHISLSMLAILCMTVPFFIRFYYKENVWCRHYCPRASFTSLIGRKRGNYKKTPTIFSDGYLKKMILIYFVLNLIFITGSTIQVSLGKMVAMPYIRLFIAIPLFPIYQLVDISLSQWALHLSYRLYSMMLSSSILGIAFGLLYRGRAWCAVCPVGTILKKIPTEAKK